MAQMKCSRCQHENRIDARFCEECAAPFEHTCPNCRNLILPGARFCSQCAHPIGLDGEHRAANRFLSPENYTPKHLADRIHEFVHSAQTAGCLILETNSASYGHAASYLPVIELLRHYYFKINLRDTAKSIRARLRSQRAVWSLLNLDSHLSKA